MFESLEPRCLFTVTAAVETVPVPSRGDSADDIAIWVNPTNSALSTVIGTDKNKGIAVYSLDGSQLSFRADGNFNNVDLRYGYELGGTIVTLVAASNRTDNTIRFYTVDPTSRNLVPVGSVQTNLAEELYGLGMYKSAITGRLHVFVSNDTDGSGTIQQWEVANTETGSVTASLVRTITVSSQSEGIVADDEAGVVYIGEEDVGIWKFGAEADSTMTPVLVDRVGTRLASDVEGLAIYHAANGMGFLIASAQGDSSYVLYTRDTNTFVGKFKISALVSGKKTLIDDVSDTDGIEVTSVGLNGTFASGMFVAQDGKNAGGNQNFKLVRWSSIATELSLPMATQNPLPGTFSSSFITEDKNMTDTLIASI